MRNASRAASFRARAARNSRNARAQLSLGRLASASSSARTSGS